MDNMDELTMDKLHDIAVGEGKKRRISLAGKIIIVLLALSVAANVALVARYLWKKAQYDDLRSVFAAEYFTFPSLTVEGFENKVASGDEFIAFISRPNCSSCQKIADEFEEYCVSEGIENKIHHVNVVYLHSVIDEWNAFKERYQLTGTPSFVRFKDGEVTSVLSWTAEEGCTIEMIRGWVEGQSDFLGT